MGKQSRSKNTSNAHASDWLLVGAFFASGFAALGYELIWTRLLSLTLGSDSQAVIGVLTGFFGGLAVGAWLLDRRIRSSASPGKWFAGLELVIGAYGVGATWLLLQLPAIAGPTVGRMADAGVPTALFSGAVGALIMAPATICMGASLPAVIAIRQRFMPKDGVAYGIGRLYAANMLGAASGIFVTVHWLTPQVGFLVGAVVLAVLNLGAAAAARQWAKGRSSAASSPEAQPAFEAKTLLFVFALTGAIAMALEVIVIRALSQAFRNTVYTFADVLAVFIAGNAVGVVVYSLAARRWKLQARDIRAVLAVLMLAAAFATFLAGWLLPILPDALLPEKAKFAAIVRSEALVAFCLLLPATVVMGAIFTHLFAQFDNFGFGRAYAVNTMGGAIGPIIAATVLVPALGLGQSLVVVGGVYLLVGVWYLSKFRPKVAMIAAGVGIGMAALVPLSIDLTALPSDRKIVHQVLSHYGVVTVSESPKREDGKPGLPRELRVDRHFSMGGGLSFAERRMGVISLLLAPEATSAVFLGVGTGTTMGVVKEFPEVSAVGVEMVPEIIEALPFFNEINASVHEQPKVRFVAADARHYLTSHELSVDLIVGELFHPARDGAAFLYSREHFVTVRDDLAAGGRFVQWLPAYQLSADVTRSIIKTFLEVFPDAEAVLGLYNGQMPTVALIGTKGGGSVLPLHPTVDQQFEKETIKRYVDGRNDLTSAYLADAEALRLFSEDAPLNTDAKPYVLFAAPRAMGESSRTLATLLRRRTPPSSDSHGNAWGDSPEKSYWEATGLYLEGDLERAKAGLKAVGAVEKYVEALIVEPNFRPALGMITAAINRQPELGTGVFEKLLKEQPDHPPFYGAYLRYLRQVGNKKRFDEVKAHMLSKANPAAAERHGKSPPGEQKTRPLRPLGPRR